MERWIYGMGEMLDVLLGQPHSPVARMVLLALGGLTMLVALVKMSGATGIPNVGRHYPVVVGAVGLAAIVLGMLLVRIYVLPELGVNKGHVYLYAGGLLLSTLLVVMLLCILQRATVGSAVATWLVSVFFAFLVVSVAGLVFDALGAGKTSLEGTKKRSIEMEKFLEDQ